MGNKESSHELDNGDDKDGKEGKNGSKQLVNQEEDTKDMSPNRLLLHYAAQGDIEGLRTAKKNGGDPNIGDNEDKTEQEDEKKKKKKGKEQAQEIYKNRIYTGDYPLHRAAEFGKVEAVKQLYLMEAKLDAKDRLGSSPLHRATSHGQVECVKELLKMRADHTARNIIANTPLHVAAMTGDTTIALLLLEAGSYKLVNTANKVDMTPLDYARKEAMLHLLQNYNPSRPYVPEDKKNGPRPEHTRSPSADGGDRDDVSTQGMAGNSQVRLTLYPDDTKEGLAIEDGHLFHRPSINDPYMDTQGPRY